MEGIDLSAGKIKLGGGGVWHILMRGGGGIKKVSGPPIGYNFYVKSPQWRWVIDIIYLGRGVVWNNSIGRLKSFRLAHFHWKSHNVFIL